MKRGTDATSSIGGRENYPASRNVVRPRYTREPSYSLACFGSFSRFRFKTSITLRYFKKTLRSFWIAIAKVVKNLRISTFLTKIEPFFIWF